MQRKIIPLLLLIVLMFCSCQAAQSDKQNDTTTPVSVEATTEATEPTETTEPMSTEEMYALATQLFQDQDYEAAKPLFEELGDYENSEDFLWATNFALDHFGFYTFYNDRNKFIFEIGTVVTVMDVSNNYKTTVFKNTFIDQSNGEKRMVADGDFGTYAFVDRAGTVEFFAYGSTPTSRTTAEKYETLYRQSEDFSFPTEPKIGMTKDEVLNSTWGEPNKVNTTITETVVYEQWCYSNSRYVYFENGKVTSIQK